MISPRTAAAFCARTVSSLALAVAVRFCAIKRALEEPLRLIASNAGHEGAIVIGKVRESAKANYGFNAETEEYTDMIAAGILDPAKVTRSALQNAASIAALMLTTEALIAEIPGRGKATAMPGGGPPMY